MEYTDIKLPDWKFQALNQQDSTPNVFENSGWVTIKGGDYAHTYNNKYPVFDGDSWYLCKPNLSATWKASVTENNKLELVLDSIKWKYQFFINNQLVAPPTRVLPADSGKISIDLSAYHHLILAGPAPTLAFKVDDKKGTGIIRQSVPVLRISGLCDSIYLNKNTFYQAKDSKLLDTTLVLQNLSNKQVKGSFELTATSIKTDEVIYSCKKPVNIASKQLQKFPIPLPITKEEVKIDLLFTDEISNVTFKLNEWKRLPYVLSKSL